MLENKMKTKLRFCFFLFYFFFDEHGAILLSLNEKESSSQNQTRLQRKCMAVTQNRKEDVKPAMKPARQALISATCGTN